jgi:hypothetical protein
LYSVFALLFFLVIGLGAFGFARLSEVNRVSEVIRNHWLRDTRILGDLSNYMSDYHTAEATQLLASTPLEFAASEKESTAPGRDREHLFERYFRGSNATGIAGTGVGLHLVSMVVALHHGEVLVESLEGVGSRFIVRLPIPTSEEAARVSSARDAA